MVEITNAEAYMPAPGPGRASRSPAGGPTTQLSTRQSLLSASPASVPYSPVNQLTSGQPLAMTDNVISAGYMFSDFGGSRCLVNGTPSPAPIITRDYSGMDAEGNATGILSRTGLPAMMLVEPASDATIQLVLYNDALGDVATDGLIGLWLYADLSAKTSSVQHSLGITPSNNGDYNDDSYAVYFNANQVRHGWNFLVLKQKHLVGNMPAVEAIFPGLSFTKYGTGAGSELLDTTGNFLKTLFIDLENFAGCKLYFDSLWTGFSSKPQFCLGVDQLSSDGIDYVLPVFEEYGWVGYVAAPRRVVGNESKIIRDWTPDAAGDYAFCRTYYDAGWDIINHTANHYNLATETNPAAIRYEIEAAKSWYAQSGFVRGQEFYASPQSGTSILAEKVITNCGIKLQRHSLHSNVHITPFGIDNPASVGSIDIGNHGAGWQKFSAIKTWIDNIVLYGATGFPFWHTVTTLGDSGSGEDLTGDDLRITKSAFEKTMAYIRQLELAGTVNVTRGMTGFYYGA
ncbi:MAG TPA: hypothetical protein DEP03_04495 [Massilia sp.]|nr:hypothetical protein [Massilia sp.]